MSLCTYYLKSSKFFYSLAKFNISTTTCHVSSNRNCSHLTCICDNLSFKFMEFSIKDLMRYSLFLKFITEVLRCINVYCSDKYRLSLLMCFYNVCNNRIEFFFLCLVYRIFIINTGNRKICRNFNNIHLINVTELFLFCKSSTCHTRFFSIFVEEVLECNSRKSFALSLNLYMLFCFYRLMKTI